MRFRYRSMSKVGMCVMIACASHFLLGPKALWAAQITVAWNFAASNMDGTPLTDLAGGKVYYGLTSSNYTHVIDVPGGEPGQAGSFTVTGLVEDVTYYLNGTAYNTAGLESDFCSEVVKVAVASSGNEPPQVSAGPDHTVSLPDPLALDATVNDDGLPQGSALTVTWSKVQGPGTVTFADEHAIDTSATFSSPGQYMLRLQATDGEYTAADEVSVTVSSTTVPSPPSNL